VKVVVVAVPVRASNFTARLIVVVLAVAILAALVTTFVVGVFLARPKTLTAVNNPGGLGVSIHLEVVGSVSSAITFPRPTDPHPTWVSYLPTTILNVPANSVVTMQIDQEPRACAIHFGARRRGSSAAPST
jgi:hypothetical protein